MDRMVFRMLGIRTGASQWRVIKNSGAHFQHCKVGLLILCSKDIVGQTATCIWLEHLSVMLLVNYSPVVAASSWPNDPLL